MDEEELEDRRLFFGAGADCSGETGIRTDVCTCLHCGLKDVNPGGAGGAIPCICCERRKVQGGVFWFRVDSMKEKLQNGSDLTICALINCKNT